MFHTDAWNILKIYSLWRTEKYLSFDGDFYNSNSDTARTWRQNGEEFILRETNC